MAQFAKINIDIKKIYGYIISAQLKGEEKISFNLNPPREIKDNSPNFSNDMMSLWINESKFN